MCRLAPSGSPGSPALPARPASPSCSPTAPSLFVDGRYQVQAREEVDSAVFTIEHLVEHPPPAWIEANLPAGAKLGYSPWLHTVDGAERLAKACAAAGAQSRRGRRQSDRRHAGHDRPPPPLGAGGAARSALCRRRRAGEARARPRRDAETPGRRAGGLRSARGLLAVQHPRQRRAAHAGGARLCASCRRRAGRRSIVDGASSATTSGIALEETRRCPRAATISKRDLAALGKSAARGAARSGRVSGGDRAARHRERRQGHARPRSDRADEGGEERRRDRRRPRRAAARRRRGDALPRLVRPRSAARRT